MLNASSVQKTTKAKGAATRKEFLMSNVRRVYVEKKPAFAVKAKELKHEISSYLGIKTVSAVRVLIRYDVENISEEVFEKA